MDGKLKVVGTVVAVVAVVGVGLYFGSGSFGQGAINSKAFRDTKCPVKPTLVFEGEADVNGGIRGAYNFDINSGSFDDIKDYVKEGCEIKIVLESENSLGYEYSDVYECIRGLSYESSFSCHFGQTSQIVDADSGSIEDEVLGDTYIEISQDGDNSYRFSAEGRKMDGSHVERFTPHAFLGSPVENSAKVFVGR